jgi:hypothetical protein
MSFTTGGLFLKESLLVADLFLNLQDWKAVKEHVINENTLQTRRRSSALKIYQQVSHRLMCLDEEELRFLLRGNAGDRAHILWVAVCRNYRFIAEFAVEVFHERFVTHRKSLTNMEFDRYFNDRAEWHSELERIKHSTRQKLRQVLFKIMREAGFLSEDKQIIAALLSDEFLGILSRNGYRELNIFPVYESVIEGRT